MAGHTNKLIGIIYLIFALLLVWKTAYMIPAFTDNMPNAFLVTLWWIGYVALVIGVVVVKPYQLMLTTKNVNMMKPAYAIFSFITGSILIIIIQWIMDTLVQNDTDSGLQILSNEWGPVIWFGYVMICVIMILVIPTYINFVNNSKEEAD